jgi:hypothetical protein
MRILNLESLEVSPWRKCQHDELNDKGLESPGTQTNLEDTLQVELLHFPLKTRRQPRVHGAAAREDDVLVEFRTGVDIGRLRAMRKGEQTIL